MTAFITYAIPLNEEFKSRAIEKYGKTAITALQAKELFDMGYYIDKHDFQCLHCGALITCACLESKASKTNSTNKKIPTRKPYFIDQCRSKDMHKSGCKYSRLNREKTFYEESNQEPKYKVKNGHIYKDPNKSMFFSIEKSKKRKEKVSSNYKDSNEMINDLKYSQTKKTVNEKINYTNIRTIEDYVTLYKFNMDDTIHKNGRELSLNQVFKSITYNNTFDKRKLSPYFNIFISQAFINKARGKENFFIIRLKENIELNGVSGNPSLIISKKLLKDQFSEVYASYLENPNRLFKVYTTLPLCIVNDCYINFCSCKDGGKLKGDSKELRANIYIERNI